MKSRILGPVVLMATLGLLFVNTATAGEWEDEFSITQDPVLQYRSYITTAPDDTVYVLWPDWTDWEDTKVMLMKSTDQGHTWTGPWVTFDGLPYDNMDICADADAVHLLLVEFYEDDENEYKWLYHAKSVDGGETFAEPVQVGERENIEAINSFTGPDNTYCIYAENYDHDSELEYNYLYVSSDGGDTWTEKPLLPPASIVNPDFVVRDGTIHMVFGGFWAQTGIMHSQSTDLGDTWSPPVLVCDGTPRYAQLPEVAVDENTIHVSWEDARFEHFNIMYSRSTDGGLSWSMDQQINDTFYGARTKLLADEEGLHIVWCQYHGDDGWPNSWGSGDYGIIWYKFSDDSGLTWSEEFRVSQNEHIPPIDLPDMGANYVKLAEYQRGFCAMWQDKRDGNFDLYMRNNLGPPCVGDLDGDGDTDQADLGILLSDWGCESDCEGDLDGDDDTDQADLGILLADWGCGT
ncbi:MAG TPA: sialidase family protein [Phycisphaerae bacterium]|nr:sialidase family protein [Phycisphaerae bacterium]